METLVVIPDLVTRGWLVIDLDSRALLAGPIDGEEAAISHAKDLRDAGPEGQVLALRPADTVEDRKRMPPLLVRCPDCGEEGERKGHQTCQYPQ